MADKTITINVSKIVEQGRDAYSALKAEIEPVFLTELLTQTEGNKTQASRVSGLDRGTINRKLKQYGMSYEKVLKGGR